MPFSIPFGHQLRLSIVIATTAIVGGAFRKFGNMVGVAEHDAAIGANCTMVLSGPVTIAPSETGTAWVMGDALYWDNAASVFTKTAAGNTKCAYAGAIKASAAATASIVLVQQG